MDARFLLVVADGLTKAVLARARLHGAHGWLSFGAAA
jgi:hypothetical protein